MRNPVQQQLVDWCVGEGRRLRGMEAILRGFVGALEQAGIRADRVFFPLKILHPQVSVAGYRLEEGAYREDRVQDSERFQAQLARSPFPPIFEGAPRLRRRLDETLGPEESPIYHELRARGFRDYVIMGIDFANGDRNAITFATRTPGGFSDLELDGMEGALGALSLLAEREHAALISTTVSQVYLGHETGPRVLAGRVHRGDVEEREAVIGFCDLRDFTSFSETHAAHEVVDRLNHYFEVVGRSVAAENGEILKFIGDAALCVFPAEGVGPAGALAAAQQMIREMPEEMRVGVALHVGRVSYGNIGASDRLDFTVIGPTVNRASRIAGLCGPLKEPLLVSRNFSALCGGEFRGCGSHLLKGVLEEIEVLAPC